MTKSPFINSKQKPSLDEIQLVLESCLPLWNRLITFIEKTYHVEGTWSTWGPAETGWNLRFKRKGRAIVALHPYRNQILVQIVLGKKEADQALQLKLGEKISQLLRDSPQLRDGRWLHIPVTNESDVNDVEKLLLAKIPPPKTK